MNPAFAIDPVARTAATAAASAPTASRDQPCDMPSTTSDGPTGCAALGAVVTGTTSGAVGVGAWLGFRTAIDPTIAMPTAKTAMRIGRRIGQVAL